MQYKTTSEGSLFEHLIVAFPDSSRSTLRSWVAHGRIQVDGRRETRTDTKVSPGSVIELAPKPLPKEGPLRIHYEDRDIIVVEKPSGLLSVAKETGEEPSVHAWLKHRYPGRVIPVVHRLDQDTSGLMVFGISDEGFRRLKEALQKGEVKRIYRAVVEGCLAKDGTWESYLLEDKYLKMQVVPRGTRDAERAVTHFTVLKGGDVYTLIECELETGKKNQIRVQAAHAGYPLAGDKKYGCKERDAFRLCLHARLLSFTHPITGASMKFECPPPKFFDRLIWKKGPPSATFVSSKIRTGIRRRNKIVTD
jgi:23S rRNA pseudouridine1911/1915/1917 synthase